MPKQVLHLLGWQLSAPARLRIDAPRRKEMTEACGVYFGSPSLPMSFAALITGSMLPSRMPL
jgi:hypothetical protein